MNCPICGQNGKIKYKNGRDFLLGGQRLWPIKVCQKDNVMWSDDYLSESELIQLYQGYPAHMGNESKEDGMLAGVFKKCLPDFDILSLLPDLSEKKILDFGCGAGSLLNRIKESGGEAYGVDFDQALIVNLSNKFDSKHVKLAKNVSDFGDKFFDAIILNHVIEHVPDPGSTIKTLHSLLKDGGVVVIATPSISSLGSHIFGSRWRGLEIPRHRVIFSPKSLRNILTSNGFLVERIIFSTRMSRGIFVSSIAPSLEMRSKKPSWRYLLHFFGVGFAFAEKMLGFFGLNYLKEEMIFLVKKDNL